MPPEEISIVEGKDYAGIIPETMGTVAHELGHALCMLELGATLPCITIQMREGYNREGFNQARVHGFCRADDLNQTDINVATSGYAGNVAFVFSNSGYVDITDAELFHLIHNSPAVLWSAEDLRDIDRARNNPRAACDNAAAIIRRVRPSLMEYLLPICRDFLADSSEKIEYTLFSVKFAPFLKKSF